MKILILTNRIPWPLNDGGNIATYNGAKYLQLRGHSITWACINTLKHFQDTAVLNETGKAFAVTVDTSVRTLGAVRGLFTRLPYNISRFFDESYRQLLIRLLRENDFDLVQCEGIYMGLYNRDVRENSRAKLVLRSHNIEAEVWMRVAEGERNFLKRGYLRNMARKIAAYEAGKMHEFDGIIPISARDEDFYRRSGYKGILKTVNAGVDAQKFHFSPEARADQVCFIGSLEWLPNLQGLQWFISRVWPQVHSEFPEATFHIAGKNPPGDLSWLSQPGVVFHGTVKDAADFMAESAIFAIPLHSGGGMKLKTVEAMAAGKAIVSTRTGVEGVHCTDGADLFVEEEPENFAARIRQFLSDPDRARNMGRAARETAVRYYSWESLAEQTEGVYRALL